MIVTDDDGGDDASLLFHATNSSPINALLENFMHSSKLHRELNLVLSHYFIRFSSYHRNSPSLSQNSERDRINSAEDNSLSVEDKARELIEFLTKRYACCLRKLYLHLLVKYFFSHYSYYVYPMYLTQMSTNSFPHYFDGYEGNSLQSRSHAAY